MIDAIFERIAAIGGTQDGAAAGQNTAHVTEQEGAAFFRPDESVKAVADADDVVTILEDGGFHRGSDDGIETGTVSSASADADFSDFSHSIFSEMIASLTRESSEEIVYQRQNSRTVLRARTSRRLRNGIGMQHRENRCRILQS